jgi:hypothetical protein
MVSSGFERSMTVYIKHEEQALMAAVDKLVKEERWDAEQPVCQSAQDLVHIIKRYMDRCSDITTRQPLFDLSRAFGAAMQRYALALQARCEKGGEKLADAQVLLLVRTTEFFANTINQLTDKMRRTVDAAFAEHINFSAATDAVESAQQAAMALLVARVEERVTPILAAVAKADWSAFVPEHDISDESEFVTALGRELRPVALAASRGLPQVFFQYFCNKVATYPLHTRVFIFFRSIRFSLFSLTRVPQQGDPPLCKRDQQVQEADAVRRSAAVAGHADGEVAAA